MRVKYEISKLHDGGSNYTIFLSHSNSSDTWQKLTDALHGQGIDIVSDKEIKAGDPDFAICIKNMICAADMEDAVHTASQVTQKGKACLFSPAAASYNYYKNFEEKGRHFKKLVLDLTK